MNLSLEAGGILHDIDITVVDPQTSLAQMYEVASGCSAPMLLNIDNRLYKSQTALASLPLRDGSIISESTPPNDADGAVEVRQVAGGHSGHTIRLPFGTWRISEGTVSQFTLTVEPSGRHSIFVPAGEEIWVDGVKADAGQHSIEKLVQTCDAVFIVQAVRQSRALSVAGDNKIPVQRRPRKPLQEPTKTPELPPAPRPVTPAEPFSWFVVAAPIPVAILAILLSPFFLLFILMTPALAAARWFESKRKVRVDQKRHDQETKKITADYRSLLSDWANAESSRLRETTPDIAAVIEDAESLGTGLWQRRSGDPDYLRLAVGIGETRLETAKPSYELLDELIEAAAVQQTTPITVDLGQEAAIGIVGSRSRRTEMAISLVTQLAVCQGPSDLQLATLLDAYTAAEWEWIKWLPHLKTTLGNRRVAVDSVSAAKLLNGLPRPVGNRLDGQGVAAPSTVVVVDGLDYLLGDFTALSFAVREHAAKAIVLAERFEDLPAICSVVVSVDDPTLVASMTSGRESRSFVPVLLDEWTAEATARHLAGYLDPDAADRSTSLPFRCNLWSVHDGEPTSEILWRNWSSPKSGLQAQVGVTKHGPLKIDLVADGPHALIAGMTGSGKSEFLRTLVSSLAWHNSPRELNFVLIDFKGGGAFDACASLPHTVGVVTDLDEHLAARALRCLTAELRHRERVLRQAGVNDLSLFHDPDQPLPRLVVVVDEFATLAAELPTFMSSLIDVAQRGRSLGIHLIMATQRPSGVVDAKIRSNTNLRICFRVQDDRDSLDVIADRRACDLDRHIPGRGYIRLDAADLSEFQTAIVSHHTAETTHLPLEIRPFDLVDDTYQTAQGDGAGQVGADADPTRSTDLQQLVQTCRAVVEEIGLPSPRVPWPAPLPTTVKPSTLWKNQKNHPWQIPLGLADLPDSQRTDRYLWSPAKKNLAIYGADSANTVDVLKAATIGLALAHRPCNAHAYVIDFSGAGVLTELERLSHVGAVVDPQDRERLLRLIDRLTAELESRSNYARREGLAAIGPDDEQPLIMLMIANFGGLSCALEEAGDYELLGRLEGLLRDGPVLGLYTVMTANHERGIPTRIAGQISTRLVMKMADPNSYLALGLSNGSVLRLPKGRAVVVDDSTEIQLVGYSSAMVEDLIRRASGPDGPAPIRVLDSDIDRAVDHEPPARNGDHWNLPLGIGYETLQPVAISLQAGCHVIVSGASGSGKTETLRGLSNSIQCADPSSQQIVLAPDSSDWPGRIQNFSSSIVDPSVATFILIDDAHAISDDVGRCLESVSAEPDVWIILAARPDVLSAPPMWIRRLAVCRTGIFLAPQPEHGDIIRCWLPRRKDSTGMPGRGYVATGGSVEYLQLFRAPALGAAESVALPSAHATRTVVGL